MSPESFRSLCRPVLGVALLVGLGGCLTPSEQVAQADADVGVIIDSVSLRVLSERAETVQRPEPEREVVGPDADAPTEVAEVRRLDLLAALAAAFETGREYKDRSESLYRAGLALTGTRFDFGPQIDSSLAWRITDAEGGSRVTTQSADVGVSQLLSTGGSVSASGSVSTSRIEGPHAGDPTHGRDYNSSISLSFTQPLARGAGYNIAWEGLKQAERDMVYAVRDFEQFRQDYAIGIASDFFDLVSQRTQLDNNEENYQRAIFDTEQAEALRLVDRNTIEDVFRSRRREVDAESNLLQARADYNRDLNSFRIRLGLPETVQIEIVPEDPPFETVAIDPDSAVRVSVDNRLDLMTARDRLQDAERALRISRDGLRTDVDLDANVTFGGDGPEVLKATPDAWSSSVGLGVDLPVQRVRERNSYRSALISLDRARRDYDVLLETVDRDIRDALRQLTRTEQQIILQRQQIEQENKAVAVTEIRVESGDAENRDLLEARQSLVSLQNQLVSQQVNHFIARLRLWQDLGLLFIDSEGMWSL